MNVAYKNWKLDRITLDGGYGYVTFTGDNATGTPVYHFYQKDHLGSNRLVVNKGGTIEQVSHYYPYGMSFAEGTNNSGNQYKYNGKELDTTNGLNLYDYDAQGLLGFCFELFHLQVGGVVFQIISRRFRISCGV